MSFNGKTLQDLPSIRLRRIDDWSAYIEYHDEDHREHFRDKRVVPLDAVILKVKEAIEKTRGKNKFSDVCHIDDLMKELGISK